MSVSPAHARLPARCQGLLAVVGPLPLDALLVAVNRSRRFRAQHETRAGEPANVPWNMIPKYSTNPRPAVARADPPAGYLPADHPE